MQVELPAPLPAAEMVERRARFTARLYHLLDEQRIDVVIADARQPDARPVVVVARHQGIELARA